MRARCAASVLLVALGTATAVAVSGAHADDPGQPAATTVVVTRTVEATYQGWPIRKWAAHAVANRREANQQHANADARGRTIARLRHVLAHKPTVTEAVQLARVVYGVDQTGRVHCESKGSVTAINHQGADSPSSILQFKPSTWASTPFAGFSIWSPYAQALAGGWMVDHGRSGEWSCGL